MFTESLSLVLEKNTEMLIEASEVAELGAVKPQDFGMLVRNKYFRRLEKDFLKENRLSDNSLLSAYFDLTDAKSEKFYFPLIYEEVSRECSEYLCDFNITPWAWEESDIKERESMLKTAVRIIANELQLPENWINGIKVIGTCDKDSIVASICDVECLDNGGVAVVGIPVIEINPHFLSYDYFESNTAVYREMVHIKQYASIDCVNPASITDASLFELIQQMRICNGKYYSDDRHIFHAHELEATAQADYFKYMLKTIVKERYV